jgi:DNA-directed RNA polymerase specialized sigma24 family protein
VYRLIYALHGGPAEDVEDLAAETFERAWRGRKRFRLRWLAKVTTEALLIAAGQNIKRLLAVRWKPATLHRAMLEAMRLNAS